MLGLTRSFIAPDTYGTLGAKSCSSIRIQGEDSFVSSNKGADQAGTGASWGLTSCKGKRIFRVEQPWQLYSSLGPRRRAGPAWMAESGTFLGADLIWASFWLIWSIKFGVARCVGSGYLGFSHEGHS